MDISMRRHRGVDVLQLSGRATADGHRRLREAFREATRSGRRRFILNLSHASSLDSLTIGETVACFKRARQRGGDVKLVVLPDGIVHELVQLVGLDRVFQIFGDEDEALASFSSTES